MAALYTSSFSCPYRVSHSFDTDSHSDTDTDFPAPVDAVLSPVVPRVGRCEFDVPLSSNERALRFGEAGATRTVCSG